QRLRSTAFELLMSHHHLDCKNCAKNKNCELQRIASRLGLKLKPKRLKKIPQRLPIDSSHPLIIYDRNKCVLCGKCVWICHEQGTGILDFAFRGISTIVTTISDIPLAEAGCNSCLACVAICPVGALVPKTGVPIESAYITASHSK
ncbi:MAG: ferredoxin, partial [Chloroflexi bacterium]|nr:ferredoxin [Chloroflexota bacterium]